MTAPSTTARQTPSGRRLTNGHQTFYAFGRDPDVSLWEMEVTPPGVEVGDPIETKTMHNEVYETFAERHLKKMTEGSITCAYDPQVYTQIVDNLIGRNGSITVHFSDGSTLDFWGYITKFEPSGITNDEDMPEAEVTVFVTNTDLSGNEAGPVMTSVAGT